MLSFFTGSRGPHGPDLPSPFGLKFQLNRKEQVETAGRQLYIFYVLRAQERDVSFYTEWAYKHFVIIVAVHKMDFEAVE